MDINSYIFILLNMRKKARLYYYFCVKYLLNATFKEKRKKCG